MKKIIAYCESKNFEVVRRSLCSYLTSFKCVCCDETTLVPRGILLLFVFISYTISCSVRVGKVFVVSFSYLFTYYFYFKSSILCLGTINITVCFSL